MSLPKEMMPQLAAMPDFRVTVLENQVNEQREVMQQLFEAFKILTEENVKKDKRLDKVEAVNAQLKELIGMHLVEGLEVVRKRVEKMDRLEVLDKDMMSVKQAVDDLKFVAASGGNSRGSRDRSPSPARLGAPAPLPFLADGPAIGVKAPTLEKIQEALDNVLLGLEYVARQRNADVQQVNVSLEKLDTRIKELATRTFEEEKATFVTSRLAIQAEIRSIRDEAIPELESEWAAKWNNLDSQFESMREQMRRLKEEVSSMNEKIIARDSKLAQLMSNADVSKKMLERTEQLHSDLNTRLLKIESDVTVSFEEIRRVESGQDQVTLLDQKLDLAKSESKSNWERVARQTKQDVDAVRVKLERVMIIKDEYERLSTEVRSLHDLVVALTTKRPETSPIKPVSVVEQLPRFAPVVSGIPRVESPPALVVGSHHQSSSDSSLSVLDDGITTSGMIARLSAFPTIGVPTGGAEMGVLRVDASTNRILWRIDNVASMLREPSRYAKILVSPEFTATPIVGGKQGETLVGRMKLFPAGSDQSRIEGSCSFYLRCLAGVVVRYSVDIGGEVLDTFECEYERQRDKGKHDFVRLNEYLAPDGSVCIGIEIRSVAAMSN